MFKLITAIAVATLTMSGNVAAAEIHALISTAVEAAMAELVPQFERASGHTLRITYGPSGGVAKRLTDGEAADLIILADTGLDEFMKQGKVVAGRTDFARTGIAVAVRKGAPRPDISSPEALKRAAQCEGRRAHGAGRRRHYRNASAANVRKARYRQGSGSEDEARSGRPERPREHHR